MKFVQSLTNAKSYVGGGNLQFLIGPILILIVLAMLVLPLPPVILDILFTFNIGVALMVLMASMFTKKPLDFASFPSILLFTTLLRLSLNVGSTRVVLMDGHEGPAAAGKVIESFGNFLIGGNFAVGVVVFLILIVINFMVVTKGAGRIAEVGARFTLDSLPGKQMAIDADLNAGLIGDEEAKSRRKEVSQEAEFYGSMDGASKFVRGDAMAGIVIMLVTIVGGLMIGMMQHGMSLGDASQTYVVLTIGDGLVAQIPALVISIAAGVIVSRVNTDQDVGEQMSSQLFSNPNIMFLAAGVIGLLGIIPGMPNVVFISFSAALGALGYWTLLKRRAAQTVDYSNEPSSEVTQEAAEASWDDVQLVETLSIEVGHRLIPMVDQRQDGTLLKRIKSVRKKFAQDVGFLPSPIHVQDNLELSQYTYVVSLKGVEIGRADLYPDKWLAFESDSVSGELEGVRTEDPAFGLQAVWINKDQREMAQVYGYTVVDASTVAATHLTHLLNKHSGSLLGRKEVQQLLDKLGEGSKELIEEVIPKNLSMSSFQRILQCLLEEEVSIRDVSTILEVLADHATPESNWSDLVADVRVGLGKAITQQWFGTEPVLQAIGLDIHLEKVIMQAIGAGSALEPNLAKNLIDQAQAALLSQDANDQPPVLLVSHPLRPVMSSFLRRRRLDIAVMSFSEVPDDRQIQITSLIGGIER